MRAYGNWCGPGWTAGQYKDASELTDEDRNVPAIDELDERCKIHDIYLHDYPEKANEINKWFINEVKGMGITGALFALAVSVAGPSPVANLQANNNMKKRSFLRKNEEDYKKELEQRNNEDFERQYMSTEDIDIDTPKMRMIRQEQLDYDEDVRMAANKRERSDTEISQNPTPAKRFPWKQLSNTPYNSQVALYNRTSTTNMEEPTSTARAMIGSSATTSDVNKGQETQITNAQASYWMQHTLTKYAPYNYYFTICRPNFVEPLQFTIKMTHPQAMINFTPALQIPVAGANTAKGFFTHNIGSNRTAWENPLVTYPKTVGGTPGVQIPASIAYYVQNYKKYTVTNCHYKITFQHTSTNGKENDIFMTYGFNTYRTAAPAEGNRYPLTTNTNVDDEMYWKDIKSAIIKTRQNDSASDPASYVLEGNYKMGQAKKTVENDSDIEVWHNIETNGSLTAPRLTEELVCRFYRAPISPDNQISNARVMIQLVYTIQFKDLRDQLMYPQRTDTATIIVDNTDFQPSGW